MALLLYIVNTRHIPTSCWAFSARYHTFEVSFVFGLGELILDMDHGHLDLDARKIIWWILYHLSYILFSFRIVVTFGRDLGITAVVFGDVANGDLDVHIILLLANLGDKMNLQSDWTYFAMNI
jgi:hypothetical protein